MVVSWWIVPFLPSVSTLPLTLVHGVGQFKILDPKKQNNFQLERSVSEIICSTVVPILKPQGWWTGSTWYSYRAAAAIVAANSGVSTLGFMTT